MKTKLLILMNCMLIGMSAANATLPVPSIISPVHGSIGQAVNVLLDWGTSAGATYYQYKLSTDPGLAGAVATSSGATSQVTTNELYFNKTYYWQVRAMSATDSSAWSVINQFSTLDGMTLVAPTNASTAQAVNVMLDWGTISGITYYDVEFDTSASFSSPLHQYQTTTSSYSYYNTSNLLFGTKYFWRCRARHTVDTTIWSATWSFTTLNSMTLVTPTNNATAQDANVLLDWGTVAGITYYDVEFDTSAGFASPLHQYQTTTSSYSYYNTSNLLFGTKYYWRARARHANDTTIWSPTWYFTTMNTVYQVSPTNAATSQSADAILDWTAVNGITNYDYALDTDASFSSPLYQYQSITSASSQVTTSNLLFGVKYYWKVRAHHASDTTAWSATWSFTTMNTTSLVSPTNGSSGQAANVILDWSLVTGITYYDVEYDTSASFSSPLHQYQSVTSASSQYTTSNLLFGTKYYWRARSRHSADTTAWSATWNFTTMNSMTLVTPANGAVNQDANVILDWSLVSGITYYDVEFDTSASFSSPLHQYQSVTSASSQYSTSNLLFGTKYYWRARSRHSADTTLWSPIWNFTTMNSMSLVTPTNGATAQALNVILDWSMVNGITYYDLEFDTTASFSSPLYQYQSVTNASSQYTTSNLRFHTKYYWRARSRHTADTTQWSTVWSFTTANYPAHVSPTNNAITVSLNPILDWGTISGINIYQYEYSTDPNFSSAVPVGTGTTSQVSLVSLSYGQTYYWRVRCAHAADTSDWSIPWNFTTLYQLTSQVVLSSPANTITGLSSPVTLSWQSYATAIFYEYQYDVNSSFTSPVTGTTTNTSQLTAALADGTTYYWKVRANNGSGYSPWSNVWSFTTDTYVGIDELKSISQYYPNPATSALTVVFKASGKRTLEVFDLSGRMLRHAIAIEDQQYTLDISWLKSGTYFLKVSSGTSVETIKFIKE